MAEFTRAFRVQGMDSDATPRFQMVPSGGVDKRFVVLRDGAGMTVTMADRTVCNFTEISEAALPREDRAPLQRGDRFFRLSGGRTATTTTMTATGGSGGTVSLEIGVKNEIEVLIAFNFLRDNARPQHRSTRPEADAARFLATARFIWSRQANVKLRQIGGLRRPVIAQDLTGTILVNLSPFRPAGSVARAINDIGASGVNLNVFFVHNLQVAATATTVDTDAVTTVNTQNDGIASPGLCLFEDAAGGGQALSFAHEIGHHLGLSDRALPTKDLMHGTTGARGLNLTKADVNTVNP